MSVLRVLLKKGVSWKWDREEEQAFIQVKNFLKKADFLAHYDPK